MKKTFYAIWAGELVSSVGSGLTAFTLGVYAFGVTGKASTSVLVTLLSFLPSFLLRPVGGILADRLDRRLLMAIGNVGSACGITCAAIFFPRDASSMWHLFPGVCAASVFSAFQAPAYKASVTDLVDPEEYPKASGLMQLAESAQFLVSPIVAGILLAVADPRTILVIDVATFLVAAGIALAVSVRGVSVSRPESQKNVGAGMVDPFRELAEGAKAIAGNRGVLALVVATSFVLFCLGLLQSLAAPMALCFASPSSMGLMQSLCATGVLAGALALGFANGLVKKGSERKVIVLSLSLMGVFLALFGFRPNPFGIVIPGFLFFAALPFVNGAIDALIRRNVDNAAQGRAWALVSMVTYSGTLAAYAVAGFLADRVFNPLLVSGGPLVPTLGVLYGAGRGRGIALLFTVAGICVIALAAGVARSRAIRALE